MAPKTLVSIGKASEALGVSEATLRLWTDQGRVKAFITPGGHRRYSLEEIERFMSPRRRTLGIKGLAKELAQTSTAHREIAHKSPGSDWYLSLTPGENQKLLKLGRELLDLVVKHLKTPAKRKETVELARDNGREHGIVLAQMGLSLTDAVETFIQHRGHIVRSIAVLMNKNSVQTRRITEALPSVNHLIDEALLAMVSSHQNTLRVMSPPSDGGSGR